MKADSKSGAGAVEQAGSSGSGNAAVAETKVHKVKDVVATDEHAGKGGSYVFDPATGKRVQSAEYQAGLDEARLVEMKRAEVKAAKDKANEEEGN